MGWDWGLDSRYHHEGASSYHHATAPAAAGFLQTVVFWSFSGI